MRCAQCGSELKNQQCPTCNLEGSNKLKKFFSSPGVITMAIIWTASSIVMMATGEYRQLVIEPYTSSNPGGASLIAAVFVIIAGYFFYLPLGYFAPIWLKKQNEYHKSLATKKPQPSESNRTAGESAMSIDQLIDTMDGLEFEHFCADLLRKNGFTSVEVTKSSGDQGIDVLAQKDGIKYAIQCKRYQSDVGNSAVQQAYAGKSFYGSHVAAVLTNMKFTPSAINLANNTGVLLWDRSKLIALYTQQN